MPDAKTQNLAEVAKSLLVSEPAEDTTTVSDDPDASGGGSMLAPTEGENGEGADTEGQTTDTTPLTDGEEDEGGEGESAPSSSDDDGDEVNEDDEQEDAQGTGQTLDVTDDDLIEVVIDGQTQLKTLGELKLAMSGEGAIEKRLQDVTEERKAARAERAAQVNEAMEAQAVLGQVVGAIEQVLFMPTVEQPSEQLRMTNPAQYNADWIAYQQEQDRIKQGRDQLGQLFQKHADMVAGDRQKIQEREGALLYEKLPVLGDKAKGKKAAQAIQDAAMHYGFTPQEIGLAADHRLFLMAYDAAQYRALKDKKENVVDLGKRERKPPRTLRSGKTTAGKKVSHRVKQMDAAKKRAAESGKVKDIAATLVQPAPKRRR